MKFSGRIDQIYDEMYYLKSDDEEYIEPTMMEIFDDFTEHFECTNFMFAFEDKDKSGVFDRKPHYHFIFESDAKQDTMRRFLSKHGFKGTLASLKTVPQENWEAAITYTLKQQQVVFTDLSDSQLSAYLSASRNYNAEIVKSKNITMDVLEKVVETLRVANATRRDIAYNIFKEYELINLKSDSWDNYYCVPNGIQLLRMIQYVESKTTFTSYDRWLEDNEKIISPSTHRETQRVKHINNSYEEIYEME